MRAPRWMWLAGLLAGGCTVGPDYQPPALGELTDPPFAAPDDAASGAGTLDVERLGRWWRLLDDPELSLMVERALQGNLELAATVERIVAARARRGLESAAGSPQLDATLGYDRFQTGDDGFPLFGAPPGTGADLNASGLELSWELDLWGRVARSVEAAEADIAFRVEDHRAARVALAAEVAREVVAIRALDAELAVVRAGIDADRDALQIAEARARAGFADALDALRARRTLESDLAAVPDLQARRRAAELRVAELLGERSDAVTVGIAEAMPRRDVVPGLGVPADLLARRPDVRRAERALAAASARIGAAEAERYPSISLAGSLNLQGPQFADVANPDAYVMRVGPSLRIPLLDGGRIEADVRLAESAWREALLQLRRSVLVAIREVEVAAMARRRAEEQVEQLLEAEATARDTETLSLDRYRAGAADFLAVTDATTRRLLLERQRVQIERLALDRLIDLYAALGGGWRPDQGPTSLARSSDPAPE